MRAASLLGLLFAAVMGVLLVGEIGTVQTTLQGLTTGALDTLIGKFTLVIVLLAVVIVAALAANAGNSGRG